MQFAFGGFSQAFALSRNGKYYSCGRQCHTKTHHQQNKTSMLIPDLDPFYYIPVENRFHVLRSMY